MRLQRKKTTTTNQKVRNATPTEYEGIKFRSKLEVATYKLFKEAGITPQYEEKSFEMVPAFSFMGVKIRPMTYKPDFIVGNYVIECKGNPNDAWPVREKVFKYHLHKTNSNYEFYVVKTQKEVKALIEKIKEAA